MPETRILSPSPTTADVTRKRDDWMRVLARSAKWVTVTLLIIAGLAFIVIGPGARLLGYETRAVISGSMSPTIPEGSAVFVQTRFDHEALDVGDITLFSVPGQNRQVMHRIVAVDETLTGTEFVTRGDANQNNDPSSIAASQVVGIVEAHIPRVGGTVIITRSREGAALLLAIPALAILLFECRFWYRFIRYGRSAFEPESAPPVPSSWTAKQTPNPTGARP